ncbi:MAG: hypothetical protein P4L81_04735 [Candidatus Pacebacteria bacterium]|nr:hypothetical protein [Candidatus Paceibacterota bacterium]
MSGNILMTLVVVAIALIASSFYITSREKESAMLNRITSISQVVQTAPTVCSYGIGTYGMGGSGALYIENGKIRVDIQDLQLPDFVGPLQAIIGSDGTRVVDPLTLKTAGGASKVAEVLNRVITQAPWNCSPWWFVDGSLLTIPNGVSF